MEIKRPSFLRYKRKRTIFEYCQIISIYKHLINNECTEMYAVNFIANKHNISVELIKMIINESENLNLKDYI